ncbi:MAG: hypothetical protein WC667_04845 [Sulfurimonas sp.]|jgi:hypothetical protein
MIIWNWQETIAERFSRQAIFDDLLKEDSMVFTMAKEDVAKILQTTNYSFVYQKLSFDDVYSAATCVTQNQIIKILQKKKGFLFCKDNCEFKNSELVKKIIQRITNNIKNLFDDRYKTCIRNDLFFINKFENAITEDDHDVLSILIAEETQKEDADKKSTEYREYLEFMKEIIKVDSDGQTSLSFA